MRVHGHGNRVEDYGIRGQIGDWVLAVLVSDRCMVQMVEV